MWALAVLLFVCVGLVSRALRQFALRSAVLLIDVALLPLKLGRRVFAPRSASLHK
jgi:hypothetical protein